ncbi:MAG: hypothetical protein LBN23_08620 [Paludibacter sp.]|jgi:hypothetical protein|nr:hypothetical protein [Paludibacter sp.]
MQGLALILSFGFLGFTIWRLIGLFKAAPQEYQLMLNEVFKKRGLCPADIMATDCKMITPCDKINIVIGIKNGVVSFFGDGKSNWFTPLNRNLLLYSIDKKVLFCDYENSYKSIRKKLLKENYDFCLNRYSDARNLFPKNENKHFKHLFDVPVEDIVEVSGKDIGENIVELHIECKDRMIKLSPYCKNQATKVDTVNTLIDAFDKIIDNTLSDVKISSINEDIHAIITEDARITSKRENKRAAAIFGAVVGVAAAAGVGAAVLSGKGSRRSW